MPDAVSGFWEACRNLESLSMNAVHFEGERVSIPSDTVLDRMRTLVMEDVVFGGMRPLGIEDFEMIRPEHLAIVFHCPILESFELKISDFRVRMAIHHPLHKERRPQLDPLNIPWYLRNDEGWTSVLEGIGNCFENILCLHLRSDGFGPRTLKALGTHFRHLADLRLTFSNSAVIQGVLCSCPALEILHAQVVSVKDIAEGEPWVCRHLRELQVVFFCGTTDQALQPLVFERLSTLTRLVTLDMNRQQHYIGYNNQLKFRLDCGLGQLANLQALTYLAFLGSNRACQKQRLETGDIEWMVSNWKRLKGIYGDLNEDPQVEAQLKVTLEHHGIAYGPTRTLGAEASHVNPEPSRDTGGRSSCCLLSVGDGGGGGVLESRLDCELGQLARLQELRTVVFDEMKDAEWMINNWKRLE
ncbi:hypothetical protein BGX34_007058 [Mortierella sp. NVP85]|nr:hypothetical protein BGX34_007058 [Mortierella sp. NVP85]